MVKKSHATLEVMNPIRTILLGNGHYLNSVNNKCELLAHIIIQENWVKHFLKKRRKVLGSNKNLKSIIY